MNTNFKPRRNNIVAIGWVVLCVSMVVGCAQNMRDGARLEPYEPSGFFEEGRSTRPLVPNTVARGQLRTDEHFYTGMTGAQAGETATAGPGGEQGGDAQENATIQPGGDQGGDTQGGGEQGGVPIGGQGGGTPGDPDLTGGTEGGGTQGGGEQAGTAQGGAQGARGGQRRGQPVDTFPYPVTREVLERGQNRYNIYCAPCHALTGNGDGMIVERGFSPPPSFHSDRLRDAPVGHYYDVITNGFGRMYSYASRVSPSDRWAIVAYIRALQLSQNATLEDVPADERQKLEGAGE